MAFVAVTGAKNSHVGTVTASSKLTISGVPVAVHGNPCICTSPSHASVVVPVTKVTVSGKAVAVVGSLCACGAVITTTPQAKVSIAV
jgi:uncharacterized Zn-binding protein involved in type VI secretion